MRKKVKFTPLVLGMILFLFFTIETAFARDLSCPKGSRLTGGIPPEATKWGCQKQMDNGDSIPHGWWSEWYLNGQKRVEGEYQEGERVGRWIWWYPNGMKMQEGSYALGLPTGHWSYWKPDGAPFIGKGGEQKPEPSPRIEFSDFAKNMRRDFSR